MLGDIFGFLTRAVEGGHGWAALAAFIWGVLSILLSPCHLASIPLIVGFISEQGMAVTTRRALLLSTVFSVSILITVALIGGLTVAAGRIMGDLGPIANYAVAAIFLFFGLHLLGVIPMPWSGPSGMATQRKGVAAALLLGLIFGIALGPCTFAFMAPMLGVAFRVASSDYGLGALLLGLFALGHCGVIVAAGTLGQWVQGYLNWTERSSAAKWLRVACGVLVIAGGIYLVCTAA